jgi:hypothetical protein
MKTPQADALKSDDNFGLTDEQTAHCVAVAAIAHEDPVLYGLARRGEIKAEIAVALWRLRKEHGMGSVNRSRPTKRRSRADMDVIRAAIRDTLERYRPMTVRQVFYQLVSQGVIAKSENEYKQTVIRLLTSMRLEGDIPFGWIADNTRWMRKPRTHSSLKDALRRTAECYRRSLWDNQDVYVEVWLEKEALAGVLYEVTEEWDVPLMVTRGYASLSYLHEAAEAIQAQSKPAHLYYFGDYDPSGLDITRAVEGRLREFAPDADITFERVAVTVEQIEVWGLPTRPTKSTDSRSKDFAGESVEVDAIPPEQLRALVADCIERHVDPHALRVLQVAEESERNILTRLCREYTEEAS